MTIIYVRFYNESMSRKGNKKQLTPEQIGELSERLESLGAVADDAAGQIAGVDWGTQAKQIEIDVLSLAASFRALADALMEIERGRVRGPDQRGRPVIFPDDEAERARYRDYLLQGIGTVQIKRAGEPCSRDTIARKMRKYSEELGIPLKTVFRGDK